MDKRQDSKRRKFEYYMALLDYDSAQLVGHLSDISERGFKIDTAYKIPKDHDLHLHMDLTSDVADKPSMSFVARSRWCKPDDLTPNIYNVGFEIMQIADDDAKIFQTIYQKYGGK